MFSGPLALVAPLPLLVRTLRTQRLQKPRNLPMPGPSPEALLCLHRLQEQLGFALEWSGALELLATPSFALAQSRKPRKASQDSLWVQETRAALEHPEFEGQTLISSLGALHYDLPAWLATQQRRPRILVLERLPQGLSPRKRRQWFWDYEQILEAPPVLLLAPTKASRPRKRAESMQQRDRLVFFLASLVLVLEIRPAGVLAGLLSERLARGKRVMLLGSTPEADAWVKDAGLEGKELPRLQSASPVRDAPPLSVPQNLPRTRRIWSWAEWEAEHPGPWLFHYTRGRVGPWPDERQTDYLAALLQENAGQRSSGLGVLERILEMRCIRASTNLNRGAHSVVCLTAATPGEIGAWTQWDKPLKRWTFEPYAIGFRLHAVSQLGARPVEYLPESALSTLPLERRFLFQKHAPPAVDRRPEKEWRLKGDLDFGALRREDLVVLTATEEESFRIQACYGLVAVAVGNHWPKNFQERASS